MVQIIKHNGRLEQFNGDKIKNAVRKAAERVCITLTEKEENKVVSSIKQLLKYNETTIPVNTIHNMVETALDNINQPRVAQSYRSYRDSKSQFSAMLDKVYSKKLSLNFIGDRSNANADSALVTTQKAIVYNELNSELYKKFFLTTEEEKAMSEGYIYVHDRGSRLDSPNCCLFRMKDVLKDGFFMGNLDYQEPKTLTVAFDLIGDITMNAAACQYGGFSISEIDKLLAPYAEKSYKLYYDEYMEIIGEEDCKFGVEAEYNDTKEGREKRADEYATKKVQRDFEQGFQAWEMKFNSVASSRGDYPFTSVTFGLGTGKFETMASSICMRVRKEGQGKKGFKHPVLFPKLSFFYDENLHGPEKELEWLFNEAIDCSSKAMYPDYISCTGDGYAGDMYKKYGRTISKMGCVHSTMYANVSINDEQPKLMCFGAIWNEYEKYITPIPISINEYIEPTNLKVLDTHTGTPQYVKVNKIIRNHLVTDWLRVSLSNKQTLIITTDHPLPVIRGDKTERIFAKDISEGDMIYAIVNNERQPVTINKIEDFTLVDYSFDFETETDYFNINDNKGREIESHNCRATLSPWYEKGGMFPADDDDKPVFEGRFNLGAISLHFPMIAAKAKQEGRDFYELLTHYLELVRAIHKRTFKYLSHKKAGTNPLGFCQGGFLNGYKDPDEELGEDFLKPMTLSFGITALNETSIVMTGKSLREDNTFATEVLQFINDYVARIKKEDDLMYAIYSTPGESLLILMVEQFRKKFGIVDNVSDKMYMSNSFHCGVWEDLSPIEKQDIEYPMFHLSNGGAIQYCRYRSQYNTDAIKTVVRRAMKLGFYEGVNFELDYCEDCGHQFIDKDTCPHCGSENICRIERMNGYLGYSRVRGRTMYADGKLTEFKDRVSM